MVLAVIPDQLYPSEHWYIDLMLPTSFVLVGYKVNQHPHWSLKDIFFYILRGSESYPNEWSRCTSYLGIFSLEKCFTCAVLVITSDGRYGLKTWFIRLVYVFEVPQLLPGTSGSCQQTDLKPKDLHCNQSKM